MIQGKADAFIYDQMSVWQNWKKNPGDHESHLDTFAEGELGCWRASGATMIFVRRLTNSSENTALPEGLRI